MQEKPNFFSRTLPALILGFAGGFFNAYTYVARGGVFCNAQTGNLILMALGLASGQGKHALRFLVPVVFFILANFLGEATLRKSKKLAAAKGTAETTAKFFYQIVILAVEICLLTVVGFIPVNFPALFPNALISTVAALQYHAFRDMSGAPLSTVFCTNNLRMLSERLYSAAADKNRDSLKAGIRYIFLIAIFACGVFSGYFLTVRTENYAILFTAGLLLALEGLAFFIRRKENRN